TFILLSSFAKGLQYGQLVLWDIGYEHVAGAVCDCEIQVRPFQGLLRCHSAGPENREFAVLDWYCLTEIGPGQIMHADLLGKSQVDWSAVGQWETGAYLYGTNGMAGQHRPHRDHHVTAERTG